MKKFYKIICAGAAWIENQNWFCLNFTQTIWFIFFRSN